MDLYLRKVEPGREAYRVILKDDVSEIELGSIGVQYHAGPEAKWMWGIDTVIPMRETEAGGQGKDRADCMRKFRAAWERLASDPAKLADFMRMKRQRM